MIDLLMAIIGAKTELVVSKKDCDSSWGYHLHDQSDLVDRLTGELKTELVALIDERIAKAPLAAGGE